MRRSGFRRATHFGYSLAHACGDIASAELVWKASAATLSMFDPLWLVTHEDVVVFVDQRGKMWPALPPKRPGGGAG